MAEHRILFHRSKVLLESGHFKGCESAIIELSQTPTSLTLDANSFDNRSIFTSTSLTQIKKGILCQEIKDQVEKWADTTPDMRMVLDLSFWIKYQNSSTEHKVGIIAGGWSDVFQYVKTNNVSLFFQFEEGIITDIFTLHLGTNSSYFSGPITLLDADGNAHNICFADTALENGNCEFVEAFTKFQIHNTRTTQSDEYVLYPGP